MPDLTSTSDLPHHPEFVSRRRALGSLGVGGLALMASTLPSQALFGFGAKAEIDFSKLPATWVRRQGSALQDYANYLAGLRLKRVTPMQVIRAHAKRHGSVWNTIPPKRLWRNMAPTLKVIDRMAMHLNQPVREIISAYRSPAYNARCAGAASGSWHKSNVAIDVTFASRPSTVASVARALRAKRYFKGGIGRYSGFTHVDTRGQNVDW